MALLRVRRKTQENLGVTCHHRRAGRVQNTVSPVQWGVRVGSLTPGRSQVGACQQVLNSMQVACPRPLPWWAPAHLGLTPVRGVVLLAFLHHEQDDKVRGFQGLFFSAENPWWGIVALVSHLIFSSL